MKLEMEQNKLGNSVQKNDIHGTKNEKCINLPIHMKTLMQITNQPNVCVYIYI